MNTPTIEVAAFGLRKDTANAISVVASIDTEILTGLIRNRNGTPELARLRHHWASNEEVFEHMRSHVDNLGQKGWTVWRPPTMLTVNAIAWAAACADGGFNDARVLITDLLVALERVS